jgi:hypothetical protein
MNSKMSPEKARALRDEVQKGHVRHRPSPFAPQPGTRKHRELRFDARHHDEIDQVRTLLEGLEGIDVANGNSPGSLSIWYELHDYTLKGLETALVNQGVHLNNSLHCRLMRMMIAYAEETQLRNMRMPERLIKKSHEVYSRAWDHHLHGDHDDTPPDMRQDR